MYRTVVRLRLSMRQWDKDLSLVFELVSRSIFSLEGYLEQPR